MDFLPKESLCTGCTLRPTSDDLNGSVHWKTSANVHLDKRLHGVLRSYDFTFSHIKLQSEGTAPGFNQLTKPLMNRCPPNKRSRLKKLLLHSLQDQTSCGSMSSSLLLRGGGWGSSSPVSCLSLSASTQLWGMIIFLGPWGDGPSRASMSS